MSPIGTLNLSLICRPNNQQIPEKPAMLSVILGEIKHKYKENVPDKMPMLSGYQRMVKTMLANFIMSYNKMHVHHPPWYAK